MPVAHFLTISAECCPSIIAPLAEDEAEVLAAAFAALGDPVRLRLFSILASAGETCSCDMQEPLGKSQSTVSHHTKALAAAGLIKGEKRGRWVYWRVAPGYLERMSISLRRLATTQPADPPPTTT